MATINADRAAARDWARALLACPDLMILDTETTGLTTSAQVIQIGIIDQAGAVLLDTLVKPTCRITPEATTIHGITDAMVRGAPTFAALLPRLRALIAGKRIAIYNADFDIRLLRQTATACGVALPRLTADCVMRAYSSWVGEWNARHGNYRWQPLPGGDHSAIGDARATLALIKKTAER